jgi:hypothetical protein
LGEFFAQLTSLEPEPDSDSGLCVKLSPPVVILPRKQMIPVEKSLTRFEQFGKNKGLKIKKKEKKVFDETTGEWHLSYGYTRGGKPQDDWMIDCRRIPYLRTIEQRGAFFFRPLLLYFIQSKAITSQFPTPWRLNSRLPRSTRSATHSLSKG